MGVDTRGWIELRTDHLILRSLPPGAAALLPADRAGATALVGASLDDEWPLPDILDLMPVHALQSDAVAPFGIWVIIDAETNAVIGDIGFLLPPHDTGEIEMGYSVVPSRRRRGYATEAAIALVTWALSQPEVTAIVAGTDPDNDLSQRVLERAGFERTAASASEVRWRIERPGAARVTEALARSIYLPPWRIDVAARPGVRFPLPASGIARAVAAALDATVAPRPGSVTVVLTDDEELTDLNREHMGHEGPTDVLSFPMLEPSAFPSRSSSATRRIHIGDIAISVERAIEQAIDGRGGHTGDVRWSPADEVRLLVTHGTLHLCGWDHVEPAEDAAMRALEQQLLG